jgi:hypothetical protein
LAYGQSSISFDGVGITGLGVVAFSDNVNGNNRTAAANPQPWVVATTQETDACKLTIQAGISSNSSFTCMHVIASTVTVPAKTLNVKEPAAIQQAAPNYPCDIGSNQSASAHLQHT